MLQFVKPPVQFCVVLDVELEDAERTLKISFIESSQLACEKHKIKIRAMKITLDLFDIIDDKVVSNIILINAFSF